MWILKEQQNLELSDRTKPTSPEDKSILFVWPPPLCFFSFFISKMRILSFCFPEDKQWDKDLRVHCSLRSFNQTLSPVKILLPSGAPRFVTVGVPSSSRLTPALPVALGTFPTISCVWSHLEPPFLLPQNYHYSFCYNSTNQAQDYLSKEK